MLLSFPLFCFFFYFFFFFFLLLVFMFFFFFFSSRRRHTRFDCDWSSDVCSSDLRIDRALCHVRCVGVGPQPAQVRFSIGQPRHGTRGRQICRGSASALSPSGAARRLLLAALALHCGGAIALTALCDERRRPRRCKDCERDDYRSDTHAHLVLLRQRHSNGHTDELAKCFKYVTFLYRELTPYASRSRPPARRADGWGLPISKPFSMVDLRLSGFYAARKSLCNRCLD